MQADSGSMLGVRPILQAVLGVFVCCVQARYSKSVEGVVGALVDDTVALNKTTRQVEGLVKHQQAQLQDTKEALLRWGVATNRSLHSSVNSFPRCLSERALPPLTMLASGDSLIHVVLASLLTKLCPFVLRHRHYSMHPQTQPQSLS